MSPKQFFEQLDARIANFDLLCHPFYKAWSAGELSREDLREYAQDYYHQVHAFPTYLAELAIRLDEGELRRAVLANMADEKGWEDGTGQSAPEHAELWLDFAEGMGADRDPRGHQPSKGIKDLITFFHNVASESVAEEALAAFYAYESQVPRLSQEKEHGLRGWYGANDKTCGYFSLHAAADVYHSQTWRQQLSKRLEANHQISESALAAGEAAARALWHALDGIYERTMATTA
jgi:pyrroloquinoline-quinone synthase